MPAEHVRAGPPAPLESDRRPEMDHNDLKNPLIDPNDNLFAILVAIGVAIAGGPSVLAVVGVDVGAWAMSRGFLVAPEVAVVELPLVGAGLDWRRLILVVLVLIAALVLTILTVSARRRRPREG